MAKKLRSDQISFGGTAAQFIKGDGSVDSNSYVPYSGAVSDLSLADKNLNFTSGSLSRFENGCRIFNKVFQKQTAAAQTGILSLKFPQASLSATMLDVTLKIYGYQNRYLATIRVSFYKNTATAINANGAKSVMECSETFPTNIINVGIDSTGNVAINIGDSSTNWNSYLTVEVDRVATQYTGANIDWSKGWSQGIETDTSTYQSILNIVPDVMASRSWVTTNMAGYWKKDDVGSYWRLDSNKDVAVMNGTAAQRLLSSGLLASNAYADIINIPVNGIYSKGQIKTGSHGDSSQWYSAFTQLSNYYTKNEALNLFVGKNGVETITDTKTFTQSPIVPNATLNSHAINLGQVQANFALRDGTNPTSFWRHGSYGLLSNPTIPDHIKNASGDSDLINATYGDIMGMINSPGTNLGNPTEDWYHRIKMLHLNSSGYFTEIAVQMTNGSSLWYRRFENGSFIGPNNGWIKVATTDDINGNIVVTTGYNISNSIGKFFYLTYQGNSLNDIITLPTNAMEGTRVEIINTSDVTIKVVNGPGSINLTPAKGIVLYHNGVGWLKFGLTDVKYF